MDITVTGRHMQVSDRFRGLLEDKLAKVEHFAPRTHRVDVVVSHERSSAAKRHEKVEITCHGRGPVIRAEAHADDKYAALDLALEKLAEQLRRAGDRRKVSRRRGVGEKQALGAALAGGLDAGVSPAALDGESVDAADRFGTQGEQVVQVREKVHNSAPMTLDQALNAMELVGHDFFLFQDKESGVPSVVYKRRGWEYGVLHLQLVSESDDSTLETSADTAAAAVSGAGARANG